MGHPPVSEIGRSMVDLLSGRWLSASYVFLPGQRCRFLRRRMKVYVNQEPIDVLPGTTVKHALISAGAFKEIEASKKIYDEWGNELGLDGALSEGMKIYVKPNVK